MDLKYKYYLFQGTQIWLICNDPHEQKVLNIRTTRLFPVDLQEVPNFVITAADLGSIFGHAVHPAVFSDLFVHVFSHVAVELPKFEGISIYGFVAYKNDVMRTVNGNIRYFQRAFWERQLI